MDLLAHVEARSFQTREEWIADLVRFGDQAERTWKALAKSKSERQLGMSDDAFNAMEKVGGVLFWLRHNSPPTPMGKIVERSIEHIRKNLA